MSQLQNIRTEPQISYRSDEKQAEDAITNGDIVEQGTALDQVRQGTADNSEFIVAAPSVINSDPINYAAGSRVRIAKCLPFCEAKVKVSRASAIKIGDKLEFGANGSLVKAADNDRGNAIALEALTLASGQFAQIWVRVIG